MIIKYRIKARGRPREFDTESIYENIVKASKRASARLAEIRKETRGIRGEKYLGSSTSLPDWGEEAIFLLEESKYRDLSVAEITQILDAYKTMRELGSRQSRVFKRALDNYITKDYLDNLNRVFEEGSKFSRMQLAEIKNIIIRMSPQRRGDFYTSRQFQRIQEIRRYKRVLEWAEEDSGRSMSYQEAWAYLLKRKLEDYVTG